MISQSRERQNLSSVRKQNNELKRQCGKLTLERQQMKKKLEHAETRLQNYDSYVNEGRDKELAEA